jgi:hypothetical protein
VKRRKKQIILSNLVKSLESLTKATTNIEVSLIESLNKLDKPRSESSLNEILQMYVDLSKIRKKRSRYL